MKNINVLILAVILIAFSACSTRKKTSSREVTKTETVVKKDSVSVSSEVSKGQVKEQIVDKGTVVFEKETTTTTIKPDSKTTITVRKDSLKPGQNTLSDSMGRVVLANLDTVRGLLSFEITVPGETTTTTSKERSTENKDRTEDRQSDNEESKQKNVAVTGEDRRKTLEDNRAKESTPSATGVVANYVGWGLLVLIVVIGLLIYFRITGKNDKRTGKRKRDKIAR